MSVAALILAAGRATRFGADKRQAHLPDGRCMLDVVLALYAGVFERVMMVAQDGDAFAAHWAGIHGVERIVIDPAWALSRQSEPTSAPMGMGESGMGDSLARGAQALLLQPDVSGVIVGLADMPAVSPSTLTALRQALRDHARPVVPVYQGQLGQPRGFPADCLQALAQLHGDQGARYLLDWRHQAHAVQVDDPGVLIDVDTPQDLARLPM